MRNFAINNIYIYIYMIEKHLLKKSTVFNQIVPDFMDIGHCIKNNFTK